MLTVDLRRNNMYKKVILIVILSLYLIACLKKSNPEKNIDNSNNSIENNNNIENYYN